MFDDGPSIVHQGTEGGCLLLLLALDLQELCSAGLKGDHSLGRIPKAFLEGVQVLQDDVDFAALNLAIAAVVGRSSALAECIADGRFDNCRPAFDVPIRGVEAALLAIKEALQAGYTATAVLRVNAPEWITVSGATVALGASVAILWP